LKVFDNRSFSDKPLRVGARVDLSPILGCAMPVWMRNRSDWFLVDELSPLWDYLRAGSRPVWEFAAFSQPQVQGEYAPAFKRHAKNKLNASGHQ